MNKFIDRGELLKMKSWKLLHHIKLSKYFMGIVILVFGFLRFGEKTQSYQEIYCTYTEYDVSCNKFHIM